MHGLDTPPKDPRGIVGQVIAVVLATYVLARIAFEIWEAFH